MEEVNKIIDEAIGKLEALRKEPEFKDGDRVWVRNELGNWTSAIFKNINEEGKFCIYCETGAALIGWDECKPFKP